MLYKRAIAEIQELTLKTLESHIPRDSNIAFLDYPRHQNAGDALIWQGTMSYLARMGVSVRYLASLHFFSATQLRRRLPAGATVVLSGGGNLGDRWQDIQQFRERVISELRDYRIVQLPQSVEFSHPANSEHARKVFTSHPRLTILMREQKSLDLALANFPSASIEYCPDLALGVGPVRVSPGLSDATRVLWLKRRDSESVPRGGMTGESGLEAIAGVRERDWGLDGMRGRIGWRILRLPEDITRVLPFLQGVSYPAIEKSFHRMAMANVNSATAILAPAEVVVTDRLHAMILAAMMGKEVIAYDNANGKVGAVFRDYLHKFDNVSFVPTELAATAHLLKRLR